MNIIYKKILQIKSTPIKTTIFFFGIVSSILIYCYAMFLLSNFIEEKSVFNLITYSLSVYFSYFFFRFFKLMQYSQTYDVKKKILNEIENEHIAKWTYTKSESSSFRESYNPYTKKDIKYLFLIFSFVIGLPCLIIIFSVGFLDSLEINFNIILFFIIIMLTSRDFYSFKQALKKENITVVFSKIGFVVSESYTGSFKIKLKRLIHINYDKNINKIIFTFSELIPNPDNVDTVLSITDEFPVPKRYEKDAEKLLREIKTYHSFRCL